MEELAQEVVTEEVAPVVEEVTEAVTEETTETVPVEEAGELATEATEETQADPQDGVEKKIAKLTYKRREAEREAEYWKNKAMQEPTAQPEKPVEATAPQPEQFDDYDAYIDAKAAYVADQRYEERQKQANNQAMAQAHQQKVSGIIDKGNEDYEDFDDLTRKIPLSEYALTAATEVENGHDVVYYLGKNPTEANRIANLPPVSQVMEIAKIGTKLAAPAPKAKTSAPEPIAPVTTQGKTELQYSPDMSDADYAAWRKQQT